MAKIILFANTDWYLYNFRLSLAKELRAHGHEVILLSAPGPFEPLLQQSGFRWVPSHSPGKVSIPSTNCGHFGD